MLGDDFEPILARVEEALRAGVPPTQLCRAMTYASALRTLRFHLKNEGDWHDVANIYSYAHALYCTFHYAASKELLRAIFHGAVFLTYLRWLNMPSARVPQHGQKLDEHFASSEAMLKHLGELADFQKVFEAEILVSQYLEEGRDVAKLRHTLAHIMLREDAELHMFQVLEAAFRHYDLSDDPEEKRVPPVGGDPLHHRAKGDEEHPLGPRKTPSDSSAANYSASAKTTIEIVPPPDRPAPPLGDT